MYDNNTKISKAVRIEIEQRVSKERENRKPYQNKVMICRRLRKSIRVIINKASN